MCWIMVKKFECRNCKFLSPSDISHLTMNNGLQSKRTNRDIPMEVPHAIVASLFIESKDGTLPKGTVPSIAAEYSVSRQTVYRLKQKAVKQLQNGQLDLSTQRTNCGRKSKYDPWYYKRPLRKSSYLSAQLLVMQRALWASPKLRSTTM